MRSLSSSVTQKLLIASFLVALVFLFLFTLSMLTPLSVKQNVTQVNYQQVGKYDYVLYPEATYVYGAIPLKTITQTPESSPEYPSDLIDSFNLTFTYRLLSDTPVTQVSETITITQSVTLPGKTPIETKLATKTQTGTDTAFTINFSIDPASIQADSTADIRADVVTLAVTSAAPVIEGYTQSFSIEDSNSLLLVDNQLVNSETGSTRGINYKQSGEFNYSVQLKPNSVLGAITLNPPSTPVYEPSPIIDPAVTIFPKLIDKMDMTFHYGMNADSSLGGVRENVTVIATIESPGLWSKSIFLVQPTDETGSFAITFPVDLQYITRIVETIQKETGVSGTAPVLTITTNVHTTAQTDYGQIDKVFIQTLSGSLMNGSLQWNDQFTKSETDTLAQNMTVSNPRKFLGLSVLQGRIWFSIYVVFLFGIFAVLMVIYRRNKKTTLPSSDERERIKKKYKNLVVDVAEIPARRMSDNIISFTSLDELAVTADILLKPVLHYAKPTGDEYLVVDGSVRYEYNVSAK